MTYEQQTAIDIAIAKIKAPLEWGTLEQFLEVHEFVYEGDIPAVAGVLADGDFIRVYFKVKGEMFFFLMYVKDGEVTWMESEEHCQLFFYAGSVEYTVEELSSMISIQPTDSHEIGDRRIGKLLHEDNAIFIEANNGPGLFEEKIKELLSILEKDKDNIIELAKKAECGLETRITYHNGNTILGGFNIELDISRRMVALSLDISFYFFAEGKFYKS